VTNYETKLKSGAIVFKLHQLIGTTKYESNQDKKRNQNVNNQVAPYINTSVYIGRLTTKNFNIQNNISFSESASNHINTNIVQMT